MTRDTAIHETALALVRLPPGTSGNIQIQPRWPARQVLINALAWQKIQDMQAALPSHLGLILTRAYEPRASELGKARTWFRRAGIWLFGCIYRQRKAEIADIFGSNGHDVDGTHIDLSFRLHGRRVRLLPLSVFTPLAWQKKRMDIYREALELVKKELLMRGFTLHSNQTESLQIHCDLVQSDLPV
ncbi:hypothetical protein [Undibacterium sp. TS12]|uniref:hypothetical protein n=1 Tax=Undibacterium sp. TS12 TaxID=2908202 RepID=UPI001F4D1A5B|nr:hypothetical protein [Undibacterium sp. TS12]MCH8621602.1 hypothetical protein [Undibacterium sp. TS12]